MRTRVPDAKDLLLQAILQQQAGRLDVAAALYQDALAVDGTNADAHNLLGLIADTQGRPKDANALFDLTLAGHPEFASPRSQNPSQSSRPEDAVLG
jgi:Flp pilus assembly protein TadD